MGSGKERSVVNQDISKANTDGDQPSLVGIYGCNCFSNAIMRERLPKSVFKELLLVQSGEKELHSDVAEVVASAMKDWAIERGATHYTHWFQPLTGLTAEKHDSFISPIGDGRVILEFSGKELVKGEPDASSFPSGGLRATFEARGYTAWDVSSPAFLKEDATGVTLCVPTAFISYYGHALDKKVPLLRSMDAVSRQALRVLRALGQTDASRVISTMGAEQEYFLIDRELYLRRPDLILTGRTLFGALPIKGQESEAHYFGAIREKVLAFMRDINRDLWKMGVSAKTQHNEAAPSQFELAPIFATSNVACDHNQLIMETMRKVAERHGMVALLHEKPFRGVNGSGKHNNWSLSTDSGVNLFDPGENPESNARFLLFLTAVVEAVDRYAPLLRASASNSGNDHRLGGHEAPPAIISIFLGDKILGIMDAVLEGKAWDGKDSSKLELGSSSLPKLPRDLSDRNRTSPFAFTGNKFEFRMVGSSQSIATPNMALNAATAQVFSEYADRLEKAADAHAEIQAIIRESWKAHKKVCFDGNGYSEEWVEEAARRGLPNIKTGAEALPWLASPEAVRLFEDHKVLTKEEADSRVDIYLDKYAKQIVIEARVMADMAKRSIFPAVTEAVSSLCDSADRFAASGLDAAPIQERCKAISALLSPFCSEIGILEEAVRSLDGVESPAERARLARGPVFDSMERLRGYSDRMERLVDKDFWPFPTYDELLFQP
jgi:glutamine synthetase